MSQFAAQPAPAVMPEELLYAVDGAIATITLNATEVARTANQHRSYRFDVTALLREGANELQIAFAAPVDAAQQRSAELGERPRAYPHPFNAIRKGGTMDRTAIIGGGQPAFKGTRPPGRHSRRVRSPVRRQRCTPSRRPAARCSCGNASWRRPWGRPDR